MTTVQQKPIFRDLTAEDPEPEVTEIESLCMNCHANGRTRLLLTRIPYYKNVVLMSFSCEECGFANNEIQPGGAFAELAVRWKLRVETPMDLNRQVVKSDYTSVKIPELDFEIPAQSQKGEVTTVEGIITRAIAGLTQDQASRRAEHPADADQIDSFVARLRTLTAVESAWTLELVDISGNCFVENPAAPGKDPRCVRTEFPRTKDQDHQLGIFTHEEVSDSMAPSELLAPSDPQQHTYEKLAADEVLCFRTNCPDCNAPADTNMKITNIPYFKEVVIMATNCEACGHRTNEVKSGGGVEDKGVRFEVRVAGRDDFSRDILKVKSGGRVEDKGVRFEVRVAGRDDFSRDILKSETCSMQIPELDLDVGGRALGGRFTTAEGLLRATADQLADSSGIVGDAPGANVDRMHEFVAKMNEVLDCKRSVTIILDDPAGNSYVQSLSDDLSVPDDGLKITRYERSFEQNEELGLNDMKTEGYEAAS